MLDVELIGSNCIKRRKRRGAALRQDRLAPVFVRQTAFLGLLT
jgi:hypothetical protein